jgi:hypothetical protein
MTHSVTSQIQWWVESKLFSTKELLFWPQLKWKPIFLAEHNFRLRSESTRRILIADATVIDICDICESDALRTPSVQIRTHWLTSDPASYILGSNKAWERVYDVRNVSEDYIRELFSKHIILTHLGVRHDLMIRHCQYIYVTNWPHTVLLEIYIYIYIYIYECCSQSRKVTYVSVARSSCTLAFSGEPQIDFESLWKSGAI